MRALTIRRMGAAAYVDTMKFVVVDVNGRPISGAVVRASKARTVEAIVTDSDGVASLRLDPSDSDQIPTRARIEWNGMAIERIITNDETSSLTAFFKFPVCARGPIMTTIEIAALVAGAASIGAGVYWKKEPFQVIGEVLVGAAVFTTIYRLSCM